MTVSSRPPSGNTGVISTRPEDGLSGVAACIDYLGFTLPDEIGLDRAKAAVSSGEVWEEQDHGTKGYTSSARWGEWVISWGGQSGIHVEGAGKACRQLEERPGHDWVRWLMLILGEGANFTRVDWAWDVTSGVVSMPEVRRAVKEERVVSKAHKRNLVESFNAGAQDRAGQSVYIGSGASERMLRIYDKAAQLRLPGPWVRVELQTRHRWAHESVSQFVAAAVEAQVKQGASWEEAVGGRQGRLRVEEGTLVWDGEHAAGGRLVGVAAGFQRVAGILVGYVSFHERAEGSTDGQVWRWPLASWWESLVRGIQACGSVANRAKRSVQQVEEWFERQVVPSLGMLLHYWGGDLSHLCDLARAGVARMGSRHRSMLVAAGIDP